MKIAKRFILSLSALVLLSGVAFAVPAMATEGADSTTGTQTKTEVESHAKDLTEQLKTQAKTQLSEKKAATKAQTQEHRQKACEARKANLTKRMSKAVTQANKHKEVFDKIYSRVKTFYEDKNLSVSDYDSLTADVDTAQAGAATSIEALSSLDVSVDCTSQNVAETVSTFQQGVKSTRDSLKTYRTSLTHLIKSIKGASTSTDKSTNTESSTNETGQ
ncbi:hypothetical protein KW803_00965 [Candidatus Saccharibacteria bacterium]|nr:hypothetical protein [Candidatus Saccharibacteria bacterium]